MRTVLIGDVHGCVDELEALVVACGVRPGDDVILVGDLVAKGPDSQGVVQMCRERGYRAVLGNHDDAVLRRLNHSQTDDGRGAAHRAIGETLAAADVAYLERLPLHVSIEEHGLIVVHAGFLPRVAIAAQRRTHMLNMRSLRPDGRPSTRASEGTPWAASWPGPGHVVFGHDAMRGLQRHEHATGLDTGCVYGKALTALTLPGFQLVSVPARRAWTPIEE